MDNEELLKKISLERPNFLVGDEVRYKDKDYTITSGGARTGVPVRLVLRRNVPPAAGGPYCFQLIS